MEQERSAPALEQRELVIIGGGSAGFGAAYRALQTGDFRVTLIEKNPGLGGTSVYGGVNCWEPGIGGSGVHHRLAQALLAQGDAFVGHRSDPGVTPDTPWGISSKCDAPYSATLRRGMLDDSETYRFHFEPAAMAELMQEFLQAADPQHNRLELLLQSELTGVQAENGKIVALRVRTQESERNLAPAIVIDCSAELPAARGAGCKITCGAEPRAQYQEPSAPLKVSKGLNGISQVFRVTPAAPDDVQKIPPEYQDIDLSDWLSRLEQTRRPLACFNYYPNGDINVNMLPTIEGDALLRLPYPQLKRLCEARAYAYWNWVRSRRKFRGYQIKEMFPMLGIRESVRLVGRYVLTENDLYRGYPERFGRSHTIAYADHPVDHHGENDELRRFGAYGIPYECLLPNECSNLLVACRSASFSHIAASSARLSRTMMALGEAAGAAAAQCFAHGTLPDGVNLAELRNSLSVE